MAQESLEGVGNTEPLANGEEEAVMRFPALRYRVMRETPGVCRQHRAG